MSFGFGHIVVASVHALSEAFGAQLSNYVWSSWIARGAMACPGDNSRRNNSAGLDPLAADAIPGARIDAVLVPLCQRA